ncbi:MAG: tyrosine-type recombinase/integrase [Lewinellaceae bacterium]|nr:tyrosine-type recombinase/integrase [Lewinellaceae bacterium]
MCPCRTAYWKYCATTTGHTGRKSTCSTASAGAAGGRTARRSIPWSRRGRLRRERSRTAAGIERNVSPHTLRHCYATHHLENGTNLVYLKEQLGHKHLKTTARYIHLCQSYHKRVAHPIAGMEIAYRQEAR